MKPHLLSEEKKFKCVICVVCMRGLICELGGSAGNGKSSMVVAIATMLQKISFVLKFMSEVFI
jgi:hypothetical protein